MAAPTALCPSCGEPTLEKARFCEACGARIVPEEPIKISPTFTTLQCKCGAGSADIGADGFCQLCGRKVEVADPRDHIDEVIGDDLAAVTDKGIRHKRNEDDFSIGVNLDGKVIVVCDGVSSASNSNLASRVAARAAKDELLAALEAKQDLKEAVVTSISKAHRAAMQVPSVEDGKPEAPGATIVLAAVVANLITIAWAGDSRAYWLSSEGSSQLTSDHSWLQETVAAGSMTLEQASKDSRAHAITQCIGPLNEGPPEPGVVTFDVPGEGYLLVCSDGLWGYVKEPGELYQLLTPVSVLENAQRLVDFAIKKGGVDNITAALLHFKNQ